LHITEGSNQDQKKKICATYGIMEGWVRRIGEGVINSGTPLKGTKVITSGGVQDENDPNEMKGFAAVKAESIEAAVEIAKSDPVLDIGGTIRVSQMMEMS
jgi:hypothetical protein